MRELKFRMITQTTAKLLGYVDIYDLLRNGSDVLPEFEEAVLEGVAFEPYTGLKDKNGKEIYQGDILQFEDYNGIWQAPVVFERGLFGLDVYHPKQIKNPDDWDKEYDRVDSRWWATAWGYEEFGTAFTYRTPLAKATIFKGSLEEYEKSEQKKIEEKFGRGDYYVMAEVIGNIHENKELLK